MTKIQVGSRDILTYFIQDLKTNKKKICIDPVYQIGKRLTKLQSTTSKYSYRISTWQGRCENETPSYSHLQFPYPEITLDMGLPFDSSIELSDLQFVMKDCCAYTKPRFAIPAKYTKYIKLAGFLWQMMTSIHNLPHGMQSIDISITKPQWKRLLDTFPEIIELFDYSHIDTTKTYLYVHLQEGLSDEIEFKDFFQFFLEELYGYQPWIDTETAFVPSGILVSSYEDKLLFLQGIAEVNTILHRGKSGYNLNKTCLGKDCYITYRILLQSMKIPFKVIANPLEDTYQILASLEDIGKLEINTTELVEYVQDGVPKTKMYCIETTEPLRGLEVNGLKIIR